MLQEFQLEYSRDLYIQCFTRDRLPCGKSFLVGHFVDRTYSSYSYEDSCPCFYGGDSLGFRFRVGNIRSVPCTRDYQKILHCQPETFQLTL